MRKKLNAQNLKYHFVYACVVLVTLLIFSSNALADAQIHFYQLNEEKTYEVIGQSIEVEAKLLNKNPEVELIRVDSGLFTFKGDNNQWIKLEIRDEKGNTYVRKILPIYYERMRIGINVYIGEASYTNYDKGVPIPFNPVNDQIFFELDQGKSLNEMEQDFSQHNIRRINGDYPVYEIATTGKTRTRQINYLLNNENIFGLAPLYREHDGRICRYFSNDVDVLFNGETSNEESSAIFKKYGLKSGVNIQLYGQFKNYQGHKLYRLNFSEEQMISYAFLRKLNELYNDDKVLAVITNNIAYNKTD